MSVPKFAITEDQIDALVSAFYARARKDPVLGPVFLNAVGSDDAAWVEEEQWIR